jgi:hypothetical protein
MIDILHEISQKAILLNEMPFTEEQKKTGWLGFPPASDVAIAAVEMRLGVKFPDDYVEFLKICNGFSQADCISCSFFSVDEIDFLRVLDEDLIEIWSEHGIPEVAEILQTSILVGGPTAQQFLLIPPVEEKGQWRYWKFASWIPGEEEHASLKDYFLSELAFLENQTKGLTAPKPIPVIDYSLRKAVFSLDWAGVYGICERFLLEGKRYNYFSDASDLLGLMLLASGKLDRMERFVSFLELLRPPYPEGHGILNESLVSRFVAAAREGMWFVPSLQLRRFTEKLNPTNLDAIEGQIFSFRKDLLKEKNRLEKVEYQLHFLFEYGSAVDFIRLYEEYASELRSDAHLKAATVFATLQEMDKSKVALREYLKGYWDWRPLDPFLNADLLLLWEHDWLGEFRDR